MKSKVWVGFSRLPVEVTFELPQRSFLKCRAIEGDSGSCERDGRSRSSLKKSSTGRGCFVGESHSITRYQYNRSPDRKVPLLDFIVQLAPIYSDWNDCDLPFSPILTVYDFPFDATDALMNCPWQFSSQLAISALSVFSASLV